MDNLRLILLLLGLLILAAIVLLHKPKGHSQPNHARWRQSRREPSLGETEDAGSASDSDQLADDASVRQSSFPGFRGREPELSVAQADQSRQPSGGAETDSEAASLTPPDKIVTLYIRRREERRISGPELLDAAVKAGLSFGEMKIFHRLHEGAERPVFSMANLRPPGHFDPSAWNVFETPGVALFATLPGPVSALDAWDAMLATGRRIAELLDAELLDDARCLLTRQRIAQLREEMREYDRRHGLGNGG